MSQDRVGVVIPTFNRCGQLMSALGSVLRQTRPVDEIIVVDDGSTDGTPEMLEQFARRHADRGIRIVRQENRGPSAARNAGIRASSAELIAFLDDDDVWLPHKIERQMMVLEAMPDICLLGCATDTLVLAGGSCLVDIGKWRMLVRNWFLTPGVVVRRGVLLDCGGFSEDMRYCEDYALWLKLTSRCRCALLNEVLVRCGHGKPSFGHSGLSADLDALHAGELEALAGWRTQCNAGSATALLARGLAEVRHLRRKAVRGLQRVLA